ncbi:MAG: PQQ-binding-like beta-propeller repeat protein [Gemmatimonadales bacterium]|nr:PQQ-binding-like beta-propeller repeat protein [Gemmatimonadales bacterium]
MSLVLLLGSVNAACTAYRPPPAAPVQEGAASGAAPTQVWAARAGRRLTGRVELREGTMYGAGVDRKVYAVDLATGSVVWASRMPGLVAGGVLVSGDTVYAASSRPQGRVYALDRQTGRRIWRSNTGPVSAPLALVSGTLLASTQQGELLGLAPFDGAIRWRRRMAMARIAPVETGGGSVVVATVDSIYRLAVKDGVVSHRVRSPGSIVSPWIAYRGGLVAGTTDSQIVAIDPTDLRARWSVRVDAPVLGSPAAIGDTLYAASRRGTLYRIPPGDAPVPERVVELDWPVTAPLSVMDDQLLLGGADGILRALRPDGTEVWRVQLWRPVELSPVALADGLLAIGGNGDLHRYRQ